jgi:hypothetical protein
MPCYVPVVIIAMMRESVKLFRAFVVFGAFCRLCLRIQASVVGDELWQLRNSYSFFRLSFC